MIEVYLAILHIIPLPMKFATLCFSVLSDLALEEPKKVFYSSVNKVLKSILLVSKF